MINEWIVISSVTEICFWLSQCLSTVILTFLKEKHNKTYHLHTLHFYLQNKHVGTGVFCKSTDKKKPSYSLFGVIMYASQLKAT